VIVEAHDIFGDGVNIAARLEGVAEPGGICISQTVLNHARTRGIRDQKSSMRCTDDEQIRQTK
jgi:class 3 adenylate cyclase